MRVALVGFAQSGKTSLFKILCGPRAHAEAHGAHVGVARVPDARLDALAQLHHAKKATHTSLEFLDAPALFGDPAKDAVVLGQVRGAEAFAHVVRACGEAPDPARDLAQLETEFLLADLEAATRRIEKLEHDLKKHPTPEAEHEHALLVKARGPLEKETPLRAVGWTHEEDKLLHGFQFLTKKPLLAVLNAGDDEAPTLEQVPAKYKLAAWNAKPKVRLTEICGKIEAELAELEESEAAEFLASYGLPESGRERVLHAAQAVLGWLTFFTVSEPECRAWSAPRGTLALEAAGMVHSDFARRFIKAEVIPWKELIECGGLPAARERGRVRLESKEYAVADGDVLYIRHT